MAVDSGWIAEWMREFAGRVATSERELTDLDAAIGDGDHGTNMARGTTAVVAALAAAPADVVGALKLVGKTLVSSVGGASGPLYGTLFIRMGGAATGADALDDAGFAVALRAGVDGLATRGRAELGDKTMVDALVPAANALAAAVARGADCPRHSPNRPPPLPRAGMQRSPCSHGRDERAISASVASITRIPAPPRPQRSSQPPPQWHTDGSHDGGCRPGCRFAQHGVGRAARDLAAQMVPRDDARIVLAAGMADGSSGTDAARIADAVTEADRGDGVVVLMDLGSAVLSAQLSLEFLDGELGDRVVLFRPQSWKV